MKLLTKAGAVFDRITTILAVLSGVCVVFIMLSVTADVAVRKLVNFSIPAVVEVNEYTLLYLTFFGTAWLLKENGHVRMDLVVNALRPRVQGVLNMITYVIGAIICLVLTYFSGLTTWVQYQIGAMRPTTLDVPIAYLIAAIPLGSFLLFIEFVRKIYRYRGQGQVTPSEIEGL